MIGKTAYLMACLVAIVVVATAVATAVPGSYYENNAPNSRANNLIIGYRTPDDRRIWSKEVFREAELDQVLTVQRTYNVSMYERITMVKVLDQTIGGHGAITSLLKGLPGTQSVTLGFTSLRGGPIDFFIEVFGNRV